MLIIAQRKQGTFLRGVRQRENNYLAHLQAGSSAHNIIIATAGGKDNKGGALLI
jgi:hypothetical protein